MTSANQESASDEGAALDLHSLRRRRASPERAPFVDVDTYQGVASDPAHLHKYLYAGANPVMSGDPSGHDWSFAGVLAVSGITALVASILLPSIHGAWRQAYHVAANGTTQSLFTATFNGTATLSDWKRVLSGLRRCRCGRNQRAGYAQLPSH